MIKVLLDTTYLLPTFGISVEGLTEKHLIELRQLRLKKHVEYYCIDIIWIELLGKIYKEQKKRRKNIDAYLDLSIKALKSTDFYKWITVPPDALILAFKIRKLGHKDQIDNVLYATAKVNNMIFLTMDNEFKTFLTEKGFDTQILKDHTELIDSLT
ncbi:MAG: hypothetical protein ACTSU6_03825 [Candidatus Njordarchaeales archaeon]